MTARKDVEIVNVAQPSIAMPQVAEPFPKYDDLKASEIVRRVATLDKDGLERLREFEARGRARKGILLAIEKRLAA
jgi:hypothetical protein